MADALAWKVLMIGGGHVMRKVAGMTVIVNNSLSPSGALGDRYNYAQTIGRFVFVNGYLTGYTRAIMSHEYIHVMQDENGGLLSLASYGINAGLAALNGQEKFTAGNRSEAIAYLWEGFMTAYQQFGDKAPWCTFLPIDGAEATGC